MSQPRITIGDFEPSVIVEGARTPVGRLQGALKSFSAVQLGGVAIAGALERSGVPASEVDYVVMARYCRPGLDKSLRDRRRCWAV